jgi:hypothetical protein
MTRASMPLLRHPSGARNCTPAYWYSGAMVYQCDILLMHHLAGEVACLALFLKVLQSQIEGDLDDQ